MRFLAHKTMPWEGVPKKQIWLGVIFSAVSIIFWALLWRSFSLTSIDIPLTITALSFGVLWLVSFALIVLLIDERKFAYLLYGLNALLLIGFFGFVSYGIIGVIIFGATVWYGHTRGRRIHENLLHVRPFLVLRKSITGILGVSTGFAVLLAVLFGIFVLPSDFSDLKVPRDTYSTMFKPVNELFSLFIPGYSPDTSVREVQSSSFESIAKNILSQEEFEIFQERGGFEALPESFSGEETTEQTLEEFTYNRLNTTINTLATQFPQGFPASFIIGLFLAARFLILPITWLSVFIAWLAMKLLMLYNIVGEKQIPVTQNRVVLE